MRWLQHPNAGNGEADKLVIDGKHTHSVALVNFQRQPQWDCFKHEARGFRLFASIPFDPTDKHIAREQAKRLCEEDARATSSD